VEDEGVWGWVLEEGGEEGGWGEFGDEGATGLFAGVEDDFLPVVVAGGEFGAF